jgi:hypothetical protein
MVLALAGDSTTTSAPPAGATRASAPGALAAEVRRAGALLLDGCLDRRRHLLGDGLLHGRLLHHGLLLDRGLGGWPLGDGFGFDLLTCWHFQ